MPAPAALTAQLAEQRRATQRQYVLASARARWTLLGVGVALLAAARLARLAPVSWWLIVGCAAVFAVGNGAMYRVTRDTPFRPGYAHVNIAIGSGLISTVLYALGPTGHVLYAVYLIAPLEAAWYLGPTEAWQALALNEIATAGPLVDRPTYDPIRRTLSLGLDAFQVRVFSV